MDPAKNVLIGLVFYGRMVPALRFLGNLVAGFSLVLYRQVRVGDKVRLASPVGAVSAVVEVISLGFTVLRDDQNNEVIVPNSTLMSSTLVRVSRAQA